MINAMLVNYYMLIVRNKKTRQKKDRKMDERFNYYVINFEYGYSLNYNENEKKQIKVKNLKVKARKDADDSFLMIESILRYYHKYVNYKNVNDFIKIFLSDEKIKYFANNWEELYKIELNKDTPYSKILDIISSIIDVKDAHSVYLYRLLYKYLEFEEFINCSLKDISPTSEISMEKMKISQDKENCIKKDEFFDVIID